MTKKAKKQATDTDYSSETFWNNRYETDSLGHEWYYTYDILEPLLVSMTEGADLDSCKALDVGCGDRPLVDRFHKLGLKNKNLCGMDFSKAVIDKLNAQQADAPEPIAYIKADAKNMVDFASNSYDVVVDKGTTDCLLSSSNRKAGIASALKAVSEIVRILTVTGSFMLVSHIDTDSDEFDVLISDILMPALQGKKMVDWSIKAHIVPDESQSTVGEKRSREEVRGTIYIVTSRPKRPTRNSATAIASVDFEVLEYSDDEDGEAEEEDDGEVYCMVCS